MLSHIHQTTGGTLIYTVIQDFESCEHKDFKLHLNTCHILPPQFQLSGRYNSTKTSLLQFFLLDRGSEMIFCRNACIGHSDSSWLLHSQHTLVVSDIFWQFLESSHLYGRAKILLINLRQPMTTWNLSAHIGYTWNLRGWRPVRNVTSFLTRSFQCF